MNACQAFAISRQSNPIHLQLRDRPASKKAGGCSAADLFLQLPGLVGPVPLRFLGKCPEQN